MKNFIQVKDYRPRQRKMAEKTLIQLAAMPDGRGDSMSAENNPNSSEDTGFNLQSTQTGGKPFEALRNLTGQIVISQDVDTDFSIQNEARTAPGGVSSEGLYGIAHNTGGTVVRTAEPSGNVTAEVTTVNKPMRTAETQGVSLDYYQQQMMLQQQLMLQQQQTVNALIGKVDSLSKIMEQKDKNVVSSESRCETKVDELSKQMNRKSHSKSRTHEISDSSEDESSENEHWNIESEEYDSAGSETVSGKTPTTQTAESSKTESQNSSLEQVSANMKLLKEMGQEFEKLEAVSSKVDETLAKVVNSGVRSKIDRNVAKELCNKYQRPENCEALKVPKLNKELWITGSLNKFSKEQDKMVQTAQKYLNQGLIPLVQLMESLLKEEKSNKLFKLARDSFQMLAYAHRDVSNVRRQLLKANVAEKYKQLCNDSTPITENLLGEELEKQIKTLDEMRKVGKDMSKYKSDKRKYKGHDYDKPRKYARQTYGYKNKDRSEGSFLERRARYHRPGFHNKANNKKNQKQ